MSTVIAAAGVLMIISAFSWTVVKGRRRKAGIRERVGYTPVMIAAVGFALTVPALAQIVNNSAEQYFPPIEAIAKSI